MIKKAKSKNKPKVKKPKVKRCDLSRIALAAAKAMQVPEAFTQRGLSFDINGRPAGVFKEEVVQCDALGWILKEAYRILALEGKKTQPAYWASELINEEVLARTGRSLVTISDEDGRGAVVRVLIDIGVDFKRPRVSK